MKAEVTEIKSLSGGRGSGQKVRQKIQHAFSGKEKGQIHQRPLTLEPI